MVDVHGFDVQMREAVRHLEDLVYFDHWEQASELIEQHMSLLLNEQALAHIAQLIAGCDREDYGDAMRRDSLEDMFHLISRCRAEGIGPALAPLIEKERRLHRIQAIPMAARMRLLSVRSLADLTHVLADYPALAALGVAQDLRYTQIISDVLRCAEQPNAGHALDQFVQEHLGWLHTRFLAMARSFPGRASAPMVPMERDLLARALPHLWAALDRYPLAADPQNRMLAADCRALAQHLADGS